MARCGIRRGGRPMKGRMIVNVLRVALALVFVAAAVHKIYDPEAFALAVFRYHVLPDTWINATAITLPWIELVAAAALVGPTRYADAAAWVIAALLAAFTAAILFNLWRGLDVACGCFAAGSEAAAAGWFHVGRNGVLMGAAVCVAVWTSRACAGKRVAA